MSFEQYGDNNNDDDETLEVKTKLQEVKERIKKCGIPVEVQILVAAEDDPEFTSNPIALYPIGKRSEEFWK